MTKEWNLYIYYLRPQYEEDHSELPFVDHSNPSIYAYTIDKNLDMEFRMERNPSCFYRKKVKVTSQELNKLRRVETDKELEVICMDTKFAREKLQFCMTHFEKNMVEMECNVAIHSSLWKYVNINPAVFKSKYQKALSQIMFCNGYQMLHSTVDAEHTWHYYGNIFPDIISAFVTEYGWSLKTKK